MKNSLIPKQFLITTLLFSVYCSLSSCTNKIIIKRVANQVLNQTNYSLDNLNKGKTPSRYNQWMYQNFIIMEGIEELGVVLNNKRYKNYTNRNLDFFCAYQNSYKRNDSLRSVSWYNYPEEMWHCGMIAEFAAKRNQPPNDEKLRGIKIFEKFLESAPKLKDSTFVRFKDVFYNSKAVQVDDIYMVSPFWVRMYESTGKKDYLDKAIKENLAYYKYLWDDKKQLMHCLWLEKTQKTAAHFWGRGNGWYIMALTDLLDHLPKDNPNKKQLMAIYKEVVCGLRKYQDDSGLWHQLLDVKESFTESSCSGMFTYCILKGINEGWLDASYKQIGLKAWCGLKTKLTGSYKIKDTCPPTDMSEDINYYLSRPRITNDQHAIGPFLLAGAEILKMNDAKERVNKCAKR